MKRSRAVIPEETPGAKRPSESQVSRQELIDFLAERGCDRIQVEEGSMPEESLQKIVALLGEHFGPRPGQRPLRGLHIGNFVGVSLTFLTRGMMRLDFGSLMVSIDPNITHRGIIRPAEHVLALLDHGGALANSMMLTGYSLERTIGDDGMSHDGHAPAPSLPACEHQLSQLAALCPGGFDFAVIDGNHVGDYFQREIGFVTKLLRPKGLLIADDIRDAWYEIRHVFDEAAAAGAYQEIFRDGRIGVLEKTA